jgi:Flp pilus assembly protein TadB
MMGPVTLLFLSLVAVLSVLQVACLFVVWRESARAARTLDDVTEQLRRSLAPVQENLSRAARNFAHVTDLTTLEARRADELLTDIAAKVGSIKGFLEHVVLPLGTYLGAFAAALRLTRRALRFFRRRR